MKETRMEYHALLQDTKTKDLILVLTRRFLSWVVWGMVSTLLGVALAIGWYAFLFVLFTLSGLRSWFYGADDFWIATGAIALGLLGIPVMIAHDRVMRKLRARRIRTVTLDASTKADSDGAYQ